MFDTKDFESYSTQEITILTFVCSLSQVEARQYCCRTFNFLCRNHSRIIFNFPKAKLRLSNLTFFMKLKVFCHFDSNSFQNAQNLLFSAKQILSILKAIRIKVTKYFEFHKKRQIAQS